MENQLQLCMSMPDLSKLPPLEPPEGYKIRSYQNGDSQHWSEIIAISFESQPERFNFDAIMRRDPAFHPDRIFFVTHDEKPVATASAYFRPDRINLGGMIHYVGVVPGHKGKKLGYWVTLAALHRMIVDDFSTGWLNTDDFRLPAIKTYLNLGFEPFLLQESQRERWRNVFSELGKPELSDQFQNILNGPIWVG